MVKVKWDELLIGEQAPSGSQLPSFSIVIPSYNCSQKLAWTLKSLRAQTYENFEVIVVDAGSTDRTLEEARRRQLPSLRICTVAEYNRSEMYNRGISVATGDYATLLAAGDSYVYEGALEQMAHLIAIHERPDLAYCGVLRRDGSGFVQTVLRDLSKENLQKGWVPSSLAASFFRIDTIRQLGKLKHRFRLRGGFDLVCRFFTRKELKSIRCNRVLVEHDRRQVTARRSLRRIWETQAIIFHYFGFASGLAWWLGQEHWELFRLWWKSKRSTLWS